MVYLPGRLSKCVIAGIRRAVHINGLRDLEPLARELLCAKYRMQDEQIGGDCFGTREGRCTMSVRATLEIHRIRQDRFTNRST